MDVEVSAWRIPASIQGDGSLRASAGDVHEGSMTPSASPPVVPPLPARWRSCRSVRSCAAGPTCCLVSLVKSCWGIRDFSEPSPSIKISRPVAASSALRRSGARRRRGPYASTVGGGQEPTALLRHSNGRRDPEEEARWVSELVPRCHRWTVRHHQSYRTATATATAATTTTTTTTTHRHPPWRRR